MRSFIHFTRHQILLGDQIKEDEVGRACSTHRRNERNIYSKLFENLKRRDHSEDLSVDVRIILD